MYNVVLTVDESVSFQSRFGGFTMKAQKLVKATLQNLGALSIMYLGARGTPPYADWVLGAESWADRNLRVAGVSSSPLPSRDVYSKQYSTALTHFVNAPAIDMKLGRARD